MPARPRHRTVVSCTLLAIALGAGLAGCGYDGNPLSANPYDAADEIAYNAPADSDKKVDPDKPLEITASDDDGRITDVTATDSRGRYVAGELAADGSRWHSTSPLAAGTHYTVRVSTEDDDGAPGRKVIEFDTSTPKSKTLNVTFGPRAGSYGVGQPVTAELSEPVKDKASRAVVEGALKVDSVPAVRGSWYWVDDKTLHYRPENYWPVHATITAHSNLAGMKVAERLWGGEAKSVKITTGDRIVALTDAATHQMTVYKNDAVVRRIPITTGKPGYETRNGVKVVLGKQYVVRMRGTSIGISQNSSDSYDLMVYWAAQVTYSGEYVHAAPWSVGQQGYANVSHGCTGMSNGSAQWFYDTVRQGDIVKVVNSYGKEMEPFGNGFGDWNLDWAKWSKGSALVAANSNGTNRARLRPESV
ncbi:Ig-like domain-containing protein [Streptomyces chiangmaiensis]|uniref:Ig-like domain-containing protein n=1 Tax=Streptomyces chiangmaiensis TaxID=766497 RepID=A0ABU7FUY1_9ACTN|nr:Ig-like domain-containing protein [Streptomyces chiangmaiensis]MED7827906.1 Ig-like domain-containing protein [Streptomyces chiangmaiensis]